MDAWIENLILHKKRILTASLSIFAGTVVLIGHFKAGPDAMSYAKAESAFIEWQTAPENEKLYAAMQQAIQEVPSLQKKYEPVIAQTLLNMEKFNEALALAENSLNRVKNEIPFHSAYAETSLLIQKGDFQTALERSVALKEKMGSISEKRAGSLLYAHNLLRIACLQQELKNRPGEKAGWEELETYLKKNKEASSLFMEGFADSAQLFSRYISERKQTL